MFQNFSVGVDFRQGLLRVEEDRVTILASTVDGATIRFGSSAIMEKIREKCNVY